MKVSLKKTVEAETIKNLLSAQKRIAEGGTPKDIIRITRFLLNLADKRGDVLINILSEDE